LPAPIAFASVGPSLRGPDEKDVTTVLVTGASGVLGSRLVRRLAAAGHPVRALVKPGDPFRGRLCAPGGDGAPLPGIEIREADLERPHSLRGCFDGADTVYHLAAVILSPDPQVFDRVNRQGTAHMVAGAAAAGARHFIYASSASVIYPRRTRYAESKLAGEALVKAEARFAHTIVRPTLVYDVGGGQEFMLFWRYLERFPVVPFVGDGRARKRPVWAEDIVGGLAAIAGNPRSHGKTYNFSGGESVTIRELAELMLARRGQRKPFLHLPVRLCQAAALAAGLLVEDPPLSLQAIAGLVNDADLLPDLATADLGYHPRGVREGLAHCFPEDASVVPKREELTS
jgi:nucleoside-diphosphate-sugar epimerase